MAGSVQNSGNLIQLCTLNAIGDLITCNAMGGVTVKNCVFMGSRNIGAMYVLSLPGGYTACAVYNSQFISCYVGPRAGASGMLVEDYNTIWGAQTARVNVDVGAHSITYPPLQDTRWFFEMVLNNGTLVTPFDLASYSALVELNSGTGAPATDMRGTTVQGSYREWGPLEYDSGLDTEAGSGGGGGPVIGSRIVRGLGAV